MTKTAETLKALLWEPKTLIRAIEAAGVTLWSFGGGQAASDLQAGV